MITLGVDGSYNICVLPCSSGGLLACRIDKGITQVKEETIHQILTERDDSDTLDRYAYYFTIFESGHNCWLTPLNFYQNIKEIPTNVIPKYSPYVWVDLRNHNITEGYDADVLAQCIYALDKRNRALEEYKNTLQKLGCLKKDNQELDWLPDYKGWLEVPGAPMVQF